MVGFLGSKSILHITDESLYVYKTMGKVVRLIGVMPWSEELFVPKLADILEKDAGGAPVTMLYDAVDQHYRKERVPQVSFFDSSKVVQRKIDLAFPNYPYKAFLKLNKDDKPGQNNQDSGLKSNPYLFAACPDSQYIQFVLAAIAQSGVSISGFGFLPVESSSMLPELTESLKQNALDPAAVKAAKKERKKKKGKKSQAGNQWCVFIGQNKSGGLRQIVVKNGDLALTRISPIVETDADPALWVNEISREFRATMTYLSRFGYSPVDELSIVVISSMQHEEALQVALGRDKVNVLVSDVANAARLLGLRIEKDTELRIADPLHVAWVTKKQSLAMPVQGKAMNEIMVPRRNAFLAGLAGLALLAGASYYASISYIEYYKTSENLEQARRELSQVESIYQSELDRKEALGINIQLIQNSLAIADDLEGSSLDLFDVVRKVRAAQQGVIKLQSLAVERLVEESSEQDINAQPQLDPQTGLPLPQPIAKITLGMSFSGDTDIVRGNAAVRSFGTRVDQNLSDNYEVSVTKILKDVSYRGEITREVGLSDAQGQAQSTDLTAEIEITVFPPVQDEGGAI
ncbi:MAG: hypothetical protein CL565_01970 [Alphaproteobacteria bacterium]|nr:hypothetical protein [Alphaproteobacteria bacterium]